MPSRIKPLLLTLIVCCAGGGAVASSVGGAGPTARAPTPAEIAAAVSRVSRDPTLGGETKFRTLHWVSRKTADHDEPLPAWIGSFFDFLGQAGGLALWIGGAIVVGVAAIWVLRAARSKVPRFHKVHHEAVPNQVQKLDIRPESLPDDIGAAATELLAGGRIREALSLLYRGALSRAVHRFGVRIDSASTEGEVLIVIKSALDAHASDYASRLISVWREAVYAGAVIAPESVRTLCDDFRASFDRDPA